MDDPPGYTVTFGLLLSNLSYALSIGSLVALLILCALVSASEVIFFSLQHLDLDQFRLSKNSSEQRVAVLLERPRLLLATIRVAGVFLVVGVFAGVLSLFPAPAEMGLSGFSIVILTVAVASTVILLGDFIPKTFAASNFIGFAKYASGPWKTLVFLLKPLTIPWLKIHSLLERGVDNKGHQATVEELNQALEMAAIAHGTTHDERAILRGILNFGTLTVKRVMRSKSKIVSADHTLNFHQLLEHVNRSGYSRLPVYKKTLDRIEGILHTKDLLPFTENGRDFEWQRLLRPGFFVPVTKKLDSLLKDFQEKHVHMAIVVNEYGATIGLVTLENIIEEIIGDINDEFDEQAVQFIKLDDKTFLFEGKTSLADFCRLLNIEPSLFEAVKRESKSLAGLILELNRELPRTGAKINYQQFTFVIEAADRRRIKQVKVVIHDQEKI